jgi:hypothetical protein
VDLGDYPGLVPGIALSVGLSLVLCIPLGRALGIASLTAALLLFGVGVVIAATLTPSLQAITDGAVGSGTCDLSRFSPQALDQILAFDEVSLNVILFVPLGLAVGFVPPKAHQLELVVVAAALPFLIEAVQLVVTQLDRACQSGDVVDNLVGLAIGLVVGLAAAWLMRGIRWLLAEDDQEVTAPD